MKITVAAVGKLKEDYLKEAAAHLSGSLSGCCDFETAEIPDERIEDNPSEAAAEAIKNREGRLLLKRIKPSQYVVALAIDGTPLDTAGLKKMLMKCRSQNRNDIVFIIGGSLGLSGEILRRADYKLSFSPMTFPHQLMRIILMEQIYFALK
ncbi:MAG: 23S rRNA (pseudouridine(1915)-N(3))-methyltransferase RlmH [Bacillota bacterium]|nr:23S rRNA (pseudouridine(1915)-N(3))-methyltransferase RlmH [Bacillota bacterium]